MRKIKINWKTLLITAGSLLLVVAMLGGFSVFAKDTVKINNIGTWKVGALNEVDGQYKEDKTAIYTYDAIECQGLKIKPDFDSDVTYQVFFYNEDELYLECTEKTTVTSAQYVGEVPELARYCRIVIFPSQLDEDGKQIKDFEVSRLKVNSIANNLEITVNKEQDYEAYNLLENLTKYSSEKHGTKNEVLLNGKNILLEDSGFGSPYNGNLNEAVINDADGFDIVKLVCTDYSMYKVDLSENKWMDFIFYTSSGEYVEQVKCNFGTTIVEVPDTSEDLILILKIDSMDENCIVRPYMTR